VPKYIVFVADRESAFAYTAEQPPEPGDMITLSGPGASAACVVEIRSVGGVDTILAEPVEHARPNLRLL
jgi:hypothetical protein